MYLMKKHGLKNGYKNRKMKNLIFQMKFKIIQIRIGMMNSKNDFD